MPLAFGRIFKAKHQRFGLANQLIGNLRGNSPASLNR
jgi:hypothetical protein